MRPLSNGASPTCASSGGPWSPESTSDRVRRGGPTSESPLCSAYAPAARERRTKETFTVFGTSAPCEEFSNKELIDAYFSRWPKQEQIFRQLNAATSFKAAHGYGKQKVVNITVVDQMTQQDAQIERVNEKLEKARTEESDRCAMAMIGSRSAFQY